MILCYSGRSKPSALRIADASNGEILAVRSSQGDVSWGRAWADTQLNPDISNSTNKRVMRELFRDHDVPMPKLYSRQQVSDMINEANYAYKLAPSFIGRPDFHSRGRGLWKIQSIGQLRKALDGTRQKKAATHFMEYIEADREYRVHIFKGKSIRISQKGFEDDDKRCYTTVRPSGHPLRHVRRAAKQAVAALGLDFAAVDILATDDECWVLECNASPGIGGSVPELYAKTFIKWKQGEI